jgi:hypothetical protein
MAHEFEVKGGSVVKPTSAERVLVHEDMDKLVQGLCNGEMSFIYRHPFHETARVSAGARASRADGLTGNDGFPGAVYGDHSAASARMGART